MIRVEVGDRVRQVLPYTVWPTRGFTPAFYTGRRGVVVAVAPASLPVVSVRWDGATGVDPRIPVSAIERLGAVDLLAELG